MLSKRSKWILLIVILSAGTIWKAHAQDVTPEPVPAAPVVIVDPAPEPIPDDPTEPPVTQPETLLGQFFSILKDGTYIAWAAAGVVVIVGAIKLLASLIGVNITGNGAILLTLTVQVLVWVLYATANYFGQGDAAKALYLQLVDVIRSLLPLAGSIFAGHVFYQAAAKREIPVLGFRAKHPDLNVRLPR